MGVYTGTIRPRASQPNTVAGIIELFNSLCAAFEAVGMEKVDDADHSGQAGVLVSGTPGVGETQVTALGTTTGAGTSWFNVYKHPSHELYVQVQVTDFGGTTTSSRYGLVTYTIGTELAAGELTPSRSITVRPINEGMTTGSTSVTGLTANYTTLFASCDEDHFWIYSQPHVVMNVTSTSATYPDGISCTALGVFFGMSDHGRVLVTVPPTVVLGNSAPVGEQLTTSGLTGPTGAQRYYSVDGSGAWQARERGAAGYLIDPKAASDEVGLRVLQASLIINGEREHFNFGFVNSAAVADGAIVEIDLTGGGPAEYRAAHGIGPSNPAANASTSDGLCSPLFPWAE